MPRRVTTDDWDDDRDHDDDEGFDPPDEDWEPDEDEFHDTQDDGTDPCPYCGKPIYHGAERCPHCEKYISEEDAPPAAKPGWIGFTAVVCLIVVLVYWVLGRG